MIDRLRRVLVALLTGLSVAVAASPSRAQEGWASEIYNPAGAEGMLFLPLPCGGQIAFRRVVTESLDLNSPTAPLSDRQISMGRAVDRSRGFIEFRRPEYLTGSLRDPATGERFYLIGAYEVTVAQYRSVMEGPENCPPPPQRKDVLPATDVSWYDAIAFTRRLNQWIYAGTSNHLASLSQLGVDDGFVRLPTEAEWEFASRGGLSVSDAQRNEPLFYGEGDLNDYAWFNSAASSGGKIKPVGGKKPNPLGLFDVYGNAEEIVLEPFRMTRSGRLHGGIGGFVTRGGSFLDQAETLTSARRDERPFFDVQMNGEFRRRTQGFRVAVSTSSVPADLSQMSRLETAAQEIERQVPGPAEDQPTQQLARAAEQVQNRALRAEIEQLNGRLAAEFARRNELEALNLRAVLVNAVIVTRELDLSFRFQDKLDLVISMEPNAAQKAKFERQRQESVTEMNTFLSAYAISLERITAYSDEIVAAQSRSMQAELSQQGEGKLVQFAPVLQHNIQSFRRDGRMKPIVDYLKMLAKRGTP